MKTQSASSKTFQELGEIMLKEFGQDACLRGYQTIDPEFFGRNAIAFGDINPDGTLN